METLSYDRVQMDKNKEYKVVCDKVVDAHRMRCGCKCPDVILNLLGGMLVWTRIEFKCGERIRANCYCLEKM